MTIVQHLSNILSAVAHNLKPTLRDLAQFARVFLHPHIDVWV